MVSVKRASLQRAAARPARPVQSVPPQSAALPTPANQQVSVTKSMLTSTIFRMIGSCIRSCRNRDPFRFSTSTLIQKWTLNDPF